MARLFEGQTLTEWLLAANPSIDDILHVFQQICDGLAEAHRLAIIHRDLCPENVIIGPGGMVKVIDFGMAKLVAYWEHSVDQVAWTAEPETVSYRTTIKGLTPGKLYYFRFRALTPSGKSDYSPTVSLMAH